MRRLKILTWHVHGSYLWYLSHVPHEFYLPTRPDPAGGCFGRTPSYPWPENVREIPAESVRGARFDCILHQSHRDWQIDRHEILSDEQRNLPRIFLEHDPPREAPTDTLHPVDDPDTLLVHVTGFNRLMWNNRRTPSRVIEHGVTVPIDARYTGDLERGLAVVNNLVARGRRLGADVFDYARREVPLDLVGMGWEQADGLGEVRHADLPRFMSRYRFFFNPIRYTSFGLSVCEAMMVGLPVVALATTEMVTAIANGLCGYLDTKPERLVDFMKVLIREPGLARQLGEGARRVARERFHIDRFVRDWTEAFSDVTGIAPKRTRRNAKPVLGAAGHGNRIGIISEHASPLADPGGVDCGGQNVYVAHVARNLSKLGYRVDVFTRRDDKSLPETMTWQDGVRIIHVPAGPVETMRKEDLLPYMGEFTDFITRFSERERIEYDLLHANFWMSGLVAANLKKRFAWPFVITFHALGRVRRIFQGDKDEFSDERFLIEDRLIQDADRIIAECPQDFDDLMSLYNADPAKIVMIPCGYDPTELWMIDKVFARRALGLDPSLPLILQVGRMVPRKGVDFTIRGFSRAVRVHGVDAKLLIVGGDSDTASPVTTPEIGRLMRIAREEGVEKDVIFVGRKPRKLLKYYYSAADVFLTTPWYEPFGITPVEAMACGTPVIGTRVGGIKHTVLDGETGYLVAPDDVPSLGDRIAHLLFDPHLREAMSWQAVERTRQNFRWADLTAEIARAYEEVIRGFKSASPENVAAVIVENNGVPSQLSLEGYS
jgi:glycosyltransferase involved in cell wall biosynthesis